MGANPTPELTRATAELTEADRALLNLWIHRGLDDTRLGALTGMDPDALRLRRERIIAELGTALTLPVAEVLAALGLPEPPGKAETARTAPERESEVQTETEADVPQSGEPPSAPAPAVRPRRRRVWWAGAVAAVAVIVAVLLIVLSSGGTPHRATVADRSATDPATPPTTSPTTTTDPPSVRTPAPLGAFKGLPGGLLHASGAVKLLGHGTHLRLRLEVSDLPRPGHGGHYEAWLYTTVLDSRPLGRVHSSQTTTYRLPAGAGRFRFIDISFQPRGEVNHSGESRLRTVNPARELRRGHPHAATAHDRRALHPAGAARPPRPRGAHRRSRSSRPSTR